MENTVQPTQNVQDGFLNNLRRDRTNVTIYLIGGVKLTGRIRSFDKFSVVLESGSLEQLIFKHAISTISVPRGSMHHARPDTHSHTGASSHSTHTAPPAQAPQAQQANPPVNPPASPSSSPSTSESGS
ncbi:MAG: RNA chaperone Hfq [Acidobacteriota bacterium]